MSDDPRYVDDPFEDDPYQIGIPEWRKPKTDVQRRLLQSVGLKYWPRDSKEVRHRFIVIEKSMAYVSRVVPEWPSEWFDNCISWVEKKRKTGSLVSLKGFISLFFDSDAKEKFRERLTPNRQENAHEEFE